MYDTVAEATVAPARPHRKKAIGHHLRRQRQQDTTMVGELRSLIRETEVLLYASASMANEAFTPTTARRRPGQPQFPHHAAALARSSRPIQ